MERPVRLIILVMAAAGVIILASMLAPVWPQTAPVKKVEVPIKALSPDLVRKLTAPIPREVLLESIKGLPRPATPLTPAAGAGRPPVKLQMRQGPGRSKPAAAASAAGAAQIAGLNAGYEKIDWKAGLLISPFTVPRYGTANWPAAMITTTHIISMKTQEPGIVVLDWPAVSYSDYSIYNAISVELELPQEAGLYTIALKAARIDGTCSELWFSNRTKGGAFPMYAYLSGHAIPMTKLIDNSGFVGIINFEPGAAQDGSPYGMRQYNAYIEIDATTWGDSANEPLPKVGPLVFAGIIVTRL